VKKLFAQTIDKYEIESCKNWLCDQTPLRVKKGLAFLASCSGLYGPPHKDQVNNLKIRLMMDIMSAERVLRRERELSSGREEVGSITPADGIVTIDDIVTIHDVGSLDSSIFYPDISYDRIQSRPKFIKLIYQYMSHFPASIFEAYKEVTGEQLILDDLSEVREFYEICSKFDSWTAHQLCAIVSHCDPEVLDYIAKNPKDLRNVKYATMFARSDLYEDNVPLVKAAIQAGAIELIHFDRDNWLQSTLKPKKGLEWAQKKGIYYHPVLDELFLTLDKTPETSSGYTTPYLEMMREVISELEISRENQSKKEAIAAIFEQKLADHKATPPSQKLADAMATLVRLPESQQGRAKYKG
jgi:hypothetical protein